jgi:hypothetical protein
MLNNNFVSIKFMSITQQINEYKELNIEIKRLNETLKQYRTRASELKQKITTYLVEQNAPGVNYKDITIVVENKDKRQPKSKKSKDIDALNVLQSHGVYNPKEVLDKVLEARKGDKMLEPNIKITKKGKHDKSSKSSKNKYR